MYTKKKLFCLFKEGVMLIFIEASKSNLFPLDIDTTIPSSNQLPTFISERLSLACLINMARDIQKDKQQIVAYNMSTELKTRLVQILQCPILPIANSTISFEHDMLILVEQKATWFGFGPPTFHFTCVYEESPILTCHR